MIRHVLRDGTVTKDITGHVVRYTDAEEVYDLMGRLNKKKNPGKRKNNKIGGGKNVS